VEQVAALRSSRAEDHRTDATGRFGLGLSIVRLAVDALGATIEIQSAPGRGTRVRVRRPAAGAEPAA
jgi:signal transduction histidine kinase